MWAAPAPYVAALGYETHVSDVIKRHTHIIRHDGVKRVFAAQYSTAVEFQ
jgi:hypothetical protein